MPPYSPVRTVMGTTIPAGWMLTYPPGYPWASPTRAGWLELIPGWSVPPNAFQLQAADQVQAADELLQYAYDHTPAQPGGEAMAYVKRTGIDERYRLADVVNCGGRVPGRDSGGKLLCSGVLAPNEPGGVPYAGGAGSASTPVLLVGGAVLLMYLASPRKSRDG